MSTIIKSNYVMLYAYPNTNDTHNHYVCIQHLKEDQIPTDYLTLLAYNTVDDVQVRGIIACKAGEFNAAFESDFNCSKVDLTQYAVAQSWQHKLKRRLDNVWSELEDRWGIV